MVLSRFFVFSFSILFLGACSSGPPAKVANKPKVSSDIKVKKEMKSEKKVVKKKSVFTKVKNKDKGTECYIYLPSHLRDDFNESVTTEKNCKGGEKFYPHVRQVRDFWGSRSSSYGDYITVKSKGNELFEKFYKGLPVIGSFRVTKKDKLGNIIKIENYDAVATRKNQINSTTLKLKSVTTAKQLAAKKKEKEEKEAKAKAKKAREVAEKKRILAMKRAEAKAKGCKGLYVGKGIKMRKQKASIMDMINIFDSDSLNELYEVNGVDQKSKAVTLRQTKSGKLVNMSCISVQLGMK